MLQLNKTKICPVCKVDKDFSLYSNNKRNKDGKTWECKECRKTFHLSYYERNREKVLEFMRKYNIEHSEERLEWRNNHKRKIKILSQSWQKNARVTTPWICLFRGAKQRAKKKNIQFNLTKEYLESIWPKDGKCPISGIILDLYSNKHNVNSPTIDRIIPEIGYLPGNVAIISRQMNTIKQNITDPNVFRKLADWLELQLKQIKENQNG